MQFIAFDETAIDEIVSNRFFQTIEYELAQTLHAVVTGVVRTAQLPDPIRLVRTNNGLVFASTNTTKTSRFLVIDVEQSGIFDSRPEQETIFLLQKLLRFCKKLWQGMSLNFSERVIPQSNKAILFPFPYRPTPYRVVIDRAPLEERLLKRGLSGKYSLVYKAGYESGDANSEIPNYTNFRKFFDRLGEVVETSKRLTKETTKENLSTDAVIQVSMMESPENSSQTLFLSYDQWLHQLTEKQRSFVTSGLKGPGRIEGGAGTGKTLCLMLKSVTELQKAEAEGRPHHAVFVTHSEATKRSILEYLSVIDPNEYCKRDRTLERVSLKVCTLSELCAEQLAHQISEAEFIDRDALESKDTQLLYINEAFQEAMKDDYSSHERFVSEDLRTFLRNTDDWAVSEMLQHEFSVLIKGRAGDNLDAYKKCPPLLYGIPTKWEADKGFIYSIFLRYQEKLGQAAQFDTDDVVLTAIAQLDTPIWRRRRVRHGYDAIFIDETHLFNINELHIFHFFTRSETSYPITYSMDRSQSVGDRGWTSNELSEAVISDLPPLEPQKLQTVFRSSPYIVDLAHSIVASGAMLFVNFENPLISSSSGFTEAEERKSAPPTYFELPNDESIIEAAFKHAERMQRELECKKGNILIVAFDRKLMDALQKYGNEKNKPVTLLKKRGDVEAVESAEASGHFVIGHADFVGGLEFFGVVMIGVDKGRIPAVTGDGTTRNFLSYAAHNRLYVAITRARYRIEILGDKSRGPSDLLKHALKETILLTEANAKEVH
jgi:superfamily I DNA/RNA helicase